MSSLKDKKSSYFEFRLPRLQFGSLSINGYLTIILVIFAFLLGFLTNKLIYFDNALKEAENNTQPAQAANPAVAPTEDLSPKQVSIDDDPVLGRADAKVTLIEFSDYECPFCKSYFDQTYEQIKKEYVDTGKIKIVFRDLPLSFHDPLATLEAVAANCARAQGTDTTYFAYHDQVFSRTKSNGNGLTENDLQTIATDMGLNLSQFSSCLANEANKEEVRKDLADAQAVGATGTPTFFIGQSDPSGTIQGTKLVGAQPFTAFQNLIEQELKK